MTVSKNKTRKFNSTVKLFAMALMFFTCLTTLAQDDKKTGELTFRTEVIDYGTMYQNADGLRTFSFTNTGNAPVVITSAKASCGCTVPTFSKEPVLSGKTGEIQVKYATNKLGKFAKTITIMSNANEPVKKLKIKGEVVKKETSQL